jgi:arylsulfatase A-like enzyme
MKRALIIIGSLLVFSAGLLAQTPPNFIIIFTDDQGYEDLGCFGSTKIKTPNIDRMAAEGVRFTSFYAAPFCGPSRAALLTGCYPPRIHMAFNHNPEAKTGLNHDEITIAEMLKPLGYATMCIGKWHLGDHIQFLPPHHGFDHFYGLPYSNDMWPLNPRMPFGDPPDPRHIAIKERVKMTGFANSDRPLAPNQKFGVPLYLYRDLTVLGVNTDQTRFTGDYTREALQFIQNNQDQPFFLYLAHNMPHVPLFASDAFLGKSERGLYGDVIEEIDWGVGQILDKLDELGLDDNTLVVFTSDNGPWLQYGIDGGSAGPLRAGKGTTYEGGMRVPGIMRWPGKIPAGHETGQVAATMDLLPTFARLAGGSVPDDRVIDGRDIWPLMANLPDAKSPHETFYYFGGSRGFDGPPSLRGIREGDWKLHFSFRNGVMRPIELYDLAADLGESNNLIEQKPQLAARLEAKAKTFLEELTANRRPIGRVSE